MSIASDTPYQSGEDMGENETESVMGKNDRKGNVLVIGNSGVGKSTLINAVVGEQVAVTGRGTAGQTNRLEIYGEDDFWQTVPAGGKEFSGCDKALAACSDRCDYYEVVFEARP